MTSSIFIAHNSPGVKVYNNFIELGRGCQLHESGNRRGKFSGRRRIALRRAEFDLQQHNLGGRSVTAFMGDLQRRWQCGYNMGGIRKCP